jgi:heme O synthase-like polyprenyltransferase
VDRRDGRLTGRTTALTCGLLLLAALAPVPFLGGTAAWVYALGATALGVWFLARSVRFAADRSYLNARSVLRGSLVYLVGVMGLLVATGVAPRYWGG